MRKCSILPPEPNKAFQFTSSLLIQI